MEAPGEPPEHKRCQTPEHGGAPMSGVVVLGDEAAARFVRAALASAEIPIDVIHASTAADAAVRLAEQRTGFVVAAIPDLETAITSLTKLYASAPSAIVVALAGSDDPDLYDRLLAMGVDSVVLRTGLSLRSLVPHLLSAAGRVRRRGHAAEASSMVDERRHIARELHDHVIGRLFAVGMELERLCDQRAGMTELARLARSVDMAIEDLRLAVAQLRDGDRPGLFKRGVVEIIDELTNASGRDIAVTIDSDGPEPTGEIARSATAALREALTNAVKHGVGSIQVHVGLQPELAIVVSSHGTSARTPGGVGLRSLSDRARALGGGLDVEMTGDGAVVVSWWVPTASPALPYN